MASSLASQLFRMRNVDRVISTERAQKIRASFLFEGKQAADIDNQTIFDIGRDGLNELRQMNRKFDVFANSLFSPAVKDLDRVLQTREENARLDESIRSFLFLLAPYFLTKPAGKALEWLIRRFRIQEFNARDILATILPYHETKAFLTMLTIITFETRDMDLFGFLVTQRKARRLLDRTTLLAQCQRDRGLMAFVCTSVFQAVELELDYQGLHSFYATLFSQYIGGLSTVGDRDVQFVLPFVLDGLKHSGDAQIAAYMVFGTLATRVTLTADALEKTLCAIVESAADIRAMSLCLVQLAQTQEAVQLGMLPVRLLEQLQAQSSFPQEICALAAEYEVGMFMIPLLKSLAHHSFDSEVVSQLLATLVPLVPARFVPDMCQSVVREYVARGDSSRIPTVLELLELRHAQPLEDAIGACAENANELTHKLLYQLKMHSSQVGASRVLPLHATSTTLFLSINHVDAGMRTVAASALCDIVTGKTDEFTLTKADAGELLLGRLEHEDDERVLDIILELPLADYIEPSKLVSAISALLNSGRVPLGKLSDKVIDRLLEADLATEELQTQLATAVFPFVLQFKSSEAVSRALVTRLKKSKSEGWLKAVGKCAGALKTPGQYNAQVVSALGAAVAKQWAQMSNVQTGAWAIQLQQSALLPARVTAIAAGVHAVAQLATSKDVLTSVEAASLVVKAALDVACNSSLQIPASVALVSIGSAQWPQLLGELAQGPLETSCVQVAAGSIAAILGILAETVQLKPSQWFATLATQDAHDASSLYSQLLRVIFTEISSNGAKMGNAGGMLLGRLLRQCAGGDWIQFLASEWLADSNAATRAHALLTFRLLIQQESSTSADFQTVLPSIISLLGDDNSQVREAAAACIKQLRHVYPHAPNKDADQDIYMYDAFYGAATSDRMQYLPLAIEVRLVAQLAAHADSMAANASTAVSELGAILSRGAGSLSSSKQMKLNGQARSSVITYLLSHVAAADQVVPQLQTRLLQAMGAVKSSSFVDQLLPLLQTHIKQLQAQPTQGSVQDELLQALFGACFAPSMAQQISEMPQAWSLFLDCVEGNIATADAAAESVPAYMQQLAFGQLAAGLGSALPAAALTQLTSRLMSAAASGSAYAGAVSLRALFSSVHLDAETMADVLQSTADRLAASKDLHEDDVSDLVTVLELVQSSQVATDASLAPALVALLAAFVGHGGRQHGVQAYAQQLVLGQLTRIVDAASAAGATIGESVVRVDVVVQALRASSSPQTHNQALQLLAAVAVQHPDAVLHHVMAIFTFMGANVVRQDDAYSFHVIQQTLARVVPAAAQGGRGAEVARVFVDALAHIPRHRRMALFSTLVATLGPDAPATVVALLLNRSAAARLRGRAADDTQAFALSLTHELHALPQIRAADQILRCVAALPVDPLPENEQAPVDPALLAVEVSGMGAAQLRAFRLVALDFVHQLLSSRQFGAKLAALDTMQTADVALAEVAQTQLQLVAQLSAQHAELAAAEKLDSEAAERAWKQAVQLTYTVLDDVNGLMRLPLFVKTVSHLLCHDDLKVRRRALALANTRLAAGATDEDVDDVLALLEPVATVAASEIVANEKDVSAAVACQQAALLCIATAARRFASQRPAQFAEIVGLVSSTHSLGSVHAAVASAALAALAVLCDRLGPRLIPALPTYLPAVLKRLHEAVTQLDTEDNLAVTASALSTVQAIVENMGAFLAPSLSPLLTCLLSPSLRADAYDDEDELVELRVQAQTKSEDVLRAMANNVPARQLLPAQVAFFQRELTRAGASALSVAAVLNFAGRTATALSRSSVGQFHKQLFKLCLAAADIARNPLVAQADAEALEQAALDALLRLVVRLSETQFRPLFLATVDWATTQNLPAPPQPAWALLSETNRAQHAAETRLRVLYRMLNELFTRLWSLAAPYYSNVISTTVAQLQRFGVSLATIEAQEEADRKEKPAPSALWTAVLESVRLSTLHDSADEFWNEDACRSLFRPLADQLSNTKTPQGTSDAYDSYVERVRASLAPAIAQLLVAAGSDALWKMMNQMVMLKARSDYACVRHGALLVLQACYEKLGEEFLILLPETIPQLAELLEDDDPRVERATHETIKLIESYLGESLQSYMR
ncbi:snoRNA-binding rRNA-processing protein utp10 [Coemansia sp. RSA 2336]|nr:snoRNA-binding rRNA-processing protein utp10 [Coemansia sp. RSA 2336]